MQELRILVADDDDTIQTVISRILGGPGTTILQASSGTQALECARTQAPDIVILDVSMPGLDGFRVCEALRRDYRTRHIPILMVTGQGGLSHEVYGLNMGADDYMAKPYEPQRLKARAVSLLQRSLSRMGLNPLTRLPGNRAIRMEAESRLRSGRAFEFSYVDIRRFKEFNDAAGFAWGDKVIRETAEVLREAAAGSSGAFVGHIGGDDFVLITDGPVDAEDLRRRFQERMAGLRSSAGMKAAAVSLTVSQVGCAAGGYRSYDEISDAASRGKELLKRSL